MLTLLASHPTVAQAPDPKTGGSIPTLVRLVRQVTPAVVNISVHGRVREDNPLYRDPVLAGSLSTATPIYNSTVTY